MAVKKKAKKAVKAKKRPVKKAVKKVLSVRKALKRKAGSKPAVKKKTKENIIGVITHYFPHVRAAVIKLKSPLSVGDSIKIKGHTTDFKQAVTSMQIDRAPVNSAKKGEEIGLLVDSRVRQHDTVTKA